MRSLLALCITTLLLSACAGNVGNQTGRLGVVPSSFEALDSWKNGDFTQALISYARSCKRLSNASLKYGDVTVAASSWEPSCTEARALTSNGDRLGNNISNADARNFFERHFRPYLALNLDRERDKQATGLITGYYEAQLFGSRKKGGKYQHAIYRTPPEGLRRLSREQIENGALAGRKLEIAYVDDPVALFFMHIQGSGTIFLDNGEEIRAGYAAQNGHKYVAIGSTMEQAGLLEAGNVSAQTIKQWLYANPKRANRVMNENPSYIYFKETKKTTTSYAKGAANVELTPEHSVAVDRTFIPLGTPLWLETSISDVRDLKGNIVEDARDFNRLVVAQDVGGAIKGPIRADVFFGRGRLAELRAGELKNRGGYHILLPR